MPSLEKHWSCPNCTSWATTRDGKTPLHPCKGMVGLMVPLVVDGTRCKIERVDRGVTIPIPHVGGFRSD